MIFTHKIAQNAYESINNEMKRVAGELDKCGDKSSAIDVARLCLDVEARAIEVAAKIEIEMRRLYGTPE